MRKALITLLLGVALVGSAKPKQKPAVVRLETTAGIIRVELSDETFEMPDDFSPQAYFSEYFGVMTVETPMAHVVVRAHDWTPNYLRTLPLHHSQREIASTDTYTDFSFDIRPTVDFENELKKYGAGIEVLEPLELREKMRQMLHDALNRYE